LCKKYFHRDCTLYLMPCPGKPSFRWVFAGIEEVDLRADEKLGRERRRYYRLTAAGRKLARLEADRLADLLRVARAKKILRGRYV
jgi:hypothetical protein